MVASRPFLIDATFLLDDAEKAFLGAAAIIDSQGRNNSVIYGAVRDILRLRGTLGIVRGVVVVGVEATKVSTIPNTESFRDCLRALGTHVVYGPNVRVGTLCRSILDDRRNWWIVTRDKSLMQLAGRRRCGVILTSAGTAPEVVTEEKLATGFGIRPDQVPSFLALTEGGSRALLARKQAVRLLEVHGTLAAIYEKTVAVAASPKIRRHLIENKPTLLERIADLTVQHSQPTTVPNCELVRGGDDSKRTLKAYGFPSLGRLLVSPGRVDLVTKANDQGLEYVAVVDRAGLRDFKKAISSAEFLAVDTESSDKDPRKASLFGVAFSVRENQAFYLPTTQADLHGISTESVLGELRELLAKDVKVLGHNLKYDYVLLKRYDIQIAVPYFDTMLAAHECFGDWDFFNLGALAKRLLRKEVKRYRDLVEKGQTLLDVPFKDLVEHGCADADMALRLHGHLRDNLKKKGVEGQFVKDVMPLMRLLADKECAGVRVDVRMIVQKMDALAKAAATARAAIMASVGKQFNLDSLKDIDVVLRGVDVIREQIGRQPLRQNQLEQLAQGNELAREIVKYQRLQKWQKQIDSLRRAERGGRVFPLFSQVKAPSGSISSSDPKLFDLSGGMPDSIVLDKEFQLYLPDENRALEILKVLSGDPGLERDKRSKNLAVGDEPALAGIDLTNALLSIAIGVPNAALCRRFLISPRRAAVLRETMFRRFPKLFAWLSDYRRKVVSDGFASFGDRRKYWEGLGSSDMAKRSKAVQSAVRWVIGM